MASGWGSLNWILDEAAKRKETVATAPQGEATVVVAPPERRYNPVPESMDDPETRSAMGTIPENRRPETLPPLPERQPVVTPGVALKKEVARQYNFTPEATRQLYETPTHLYQVGPENAPYGGTMGGGYWPPDSRGDDGTAIMIWQNPETDRTEYPNRYRIASPNTVSNLAHEFGHKWYTENMPSSEQIRWWEQTQPQAEQRRSPGGYFHPNELYAEAVSSHNMPWFEGPYRMDTSGLSAPEYQRYYTGLFRDVPDKWSPKFAPGQVLG